RGKKSAIVKMRRECRNREDAFKTSRPVWIDAEGNFAGDMGPVFGSMVIHVDDRAYHVVVDLANGKFARNPNGLFDWVSAFEETGCQGKQWPVPNDQNTVLPVVLVSDLFPGKAAIPPFESTSRVHGKSWWDSAFKRCYDFEFDWDVGEFTMVELGAAE